MTADSTDAISGVFDGSGERSQLMLRSPLPLMFLLTSVFMPADSPHFISGLALWQWRSQAIIAAIAAAIDVSEVDWLLQELIGLDRLALRLESYKAQPQLAAPMALPELEALWQRRLRDRVPVQYLAGRTPWREFVLEVSPAVLIPRPETEGMIDLVMASPASLHQGHWADLGTGSGAIAIGLAAALPHATIHAVDRSPAALAIARANAQATGFADRIQFYPGDWLAPLATLKGQLSGLVANPPYIPSALVLALPPEVTLHEPHLALDGGPDGLDCLQQIIQTAPDYLQPNGLWLVEMMAGQAEAVVKRLAQQGSYDRIVIHPDLAGIERFVVARRKEF
jgi:release factor glutamine methyltransferase